MNEQIKVGTILKITKIMKSGKEKTLTLRVIKEIENDFVLHNANLLSEYDTFEIVEKMDTSGIKETAQFIQKLTYRLATESLQQVNR